MGPSGEPDLVRLSGKQWETHSVFWYPPSQGLVSQTFFRTKARDESKFYDVHLNSVQVRQVWPDLDLSTDSYVPLYQAAQEAYDSNERLASIVRKLCHELSQDIIGWYCELLRPRIKIYGRQPPSDKIVEAKLEGFSLRVENQSVLAVANWGGERWEGLCVKRSDMPMLVLDLKENAPDV